MYHLVNLPGAHLKSMIQRFSSQEYALKGIYKDNAFSQGSNPKDPEQSAREPVESPFRSRPEVQPLPLPLGRSFVSLCLWLSVG